MKSARAHTIAAQPIRGAAAATVLQSRVAGVPAGSTRERFHMGRIGLPEMLIVLAIVILVFGANRLPDLGRGIGRAIRNFKDATRDGSNRHE